MRKAEQLSFLERRDEPVKQPGIRGGRGYYSVRGDWRYGQRPVPGMPALPEPPPVPQPARPLLFRRPRAPRHTPEAVAAKLRASADALQPQIDRKLDPAIGHQNITARRSRIASGLFQEGQRLERTQRILRNLATAHEAGTVPPMLADVRTKPHVDALASRDYPRSRLSYGDLEATLAAAQRHGRHPGAAPATRTIAAALAAMPKVQGETHRREQETPADLMDAVAKIAALEQKDPPRDRWGRPDRGLYLLDYPLRAYRQRKQLDDAGITAETFDAAKAALAGLDTPPPPDPHAAVRQMERDIIGMKWAGYFPTPKAAAGLAVDEAEIEPGMRVLEPSAGKGDMADVIRERHPDVEIQGVEIVARLADIANAKGHPTKHGDFMAMTEAELGGPFDRVVMNPPFEGGLDADHVRHAWHFLKPGGRLVAIVSNGLTFRNDSHTQGFRNWLEFRGGHFEPLPEQSFAKHETSDRTTGVRAMLVVVDKAPAAEAKAGEQKPLPEWASRIRIGREEPSLGKSRIAAIVKLAARVATLEADLMHIDEDVLPDMDPDDRYRAVLVKSRAEMIGELVALDEALAKARGLEGQRELGPLSIGIENQRGSVRHWEAQDGSNGDKRMEHPYGYVRGTLAMDGDPLDCFLGPRAHPGHVERTDVYLVKTMHPPDFQAEDEEKAMIGWPTWREARAAFLSHYDGEERFIGRVETLAWPAFVQHVRTNRAVTKAVVEPPVSVPSLDPEPHRPGAGQRGLLFLKVHVRTYQRQGKQGTVTVGQHEDKRVGAAAKTPVGRPMTGALPGVPKQPMPKVGPGASVKAFAGDKAGWTAGKPMPAPGQQPLMASAPARIHPETAIDSHTLAKAIVAHAPALQTTVETLAQLFPGVAVAGRLKETSSLAKKLADPQKPRTLEQIQDFAGGRATFDTAEEIPLAVERIKRTMKVIDEDDYISQPKAGYRSYHLIVEHDGRPVELQLRTANMTTWADFSHDAVYKAEKAGVQLPPEVKPYMLAMSDHMSCLDGGKGAECGTPPPCPPPVRQAIGCMQVGGA